MAKSDISQAQQQTKSALGTAQQQGLGLSSDAAQGFRNFASTGGITPGQQQLTRQQAQGNVAGLYDALKQNLARRNAVQGGYSPGYGANQANLGRETASRSADAVNQANLGLLDQIRQGKLAGLGGLSGLSSEFLRQIPQLLGIGGSLAEAKPSLMSQIQQGIGIGGDLAGTLMGIGDLAGAFGKNKTVDTGWQTW